MSTEQINERMSSEAADRERRDFDNLFEGAPEGIFIADQTGRYTHVNSAGCRMLGFAREELIGRSIAELVAPSELPRQAALKHHLQSGGTEISEWRLLRKDGTYLPVELSTSAMRDGQLIAFARDITQRLKMEDALRLSEAKYSGIVAACVDAILTVDEAHRITTFNAGARNIFGYSDEEILGAPLEILLPERFRQVHRQHIERFASSREPARHMGTRSTPIFGLRKNGEEFPADASISQLQIDGKTLLGLYLRDISEQKRIEKEERLLAELGSLLMAAGSDYQRLLNDVAGLIVREVADWCTIDIREGQDVVRVRMVHADPARAATCEALARRPVHQIPNIVSEVVATQRATVRTDVSPSYLESVAQDPEHLRLLRELDPTSFIVTPLIARGRALGTLSFGSSGSSPRVGPRQVLYADRIASRIALAVDNARLHLALERAIRVRDEVLSIVAHDLRNPLSAIVLGSRSLRRSRGEPERRDQTVVDRIHRSAMRMNHLIQDLLDVTRMEGEQGLSIHQELVQPGSLIVAALEQYEATVSAAEEPLAIDVMGDQELPAVWADNARLLQVFDNLLGNARRFARTRMKVGAKARDGDVLFWVSNDGEAIAREDLPHVFDRFWQGKKSSGRGAGLGLSIVRGIVEAHRGRVWVESAPGVGTTFFFTIPVAVDTDGTADGPIK